MSDVKRCPACGTERPIGAFGFNRRNPDGRTTYCKSCHRERVARSRGGPNSQRLRRAHGRLNSQRYMRCQLERAPGYQCGALVFVGREVEHLADHGLAEDPGNAFAPAAHVADKEDSDVLSGCRAR